MGRPYVPENVRTCGLEAGTFRNDNYFPRKSWGIFFSCKFGCSVPYIVLTFHSAVSLMANKRYNKRSGRKWESKEKRDGNKWQSKEKRDGNKWQSKEKRDGNKWQNKDKRDGNKWQNKDKRDGNKWQNKDKRDGNKWQSKDKRDGKKWFSGLVINNKHGGHKRQIA